MIRKLIEKIIGKAEPKASGGRRKAPANPLGHRVELGPEAHRINPKLIDDSALRTVSRLQEAGFEAYIVGGAVRDLMLGVHPKDFDVATNATPEEVKGLFRRAFIIGRRFRIVHVVWGREVIEVSTFRALLKEADAAQVGGNERSAKAELQGKTHAVGDDGRVLRDNVWGPQDEDAARRDFTVNAMYYDPTRAVVVDYHGGAADIAAKQLRMIGDPVARYREDPVRIIRAVRLAAKLGFAIEPHTRKPLREMAALLANVPASRLFDETVKLLQTGHAMRSVAQLRHEGLGAEVLPLLEPVFNEAAPDAHHAFVQAALKDTDDRVHAGKSVVPSFLLACMLWHEVQHRWAGKRANGEHVIPTLHDAIDEVFNQRIGDISGRGKLAADMREIWLMQPRFERRTGSAPLSTVQSARYRAGFDFLLLREKVGEVPAALVDWWEDFAEGSDEERAELMAQAREEQQRTGGERPGPAKRRRRRKPKGAARPAGEEGAPPATDA
jgi:poly(A) polymerase